jgi:aminopeptidase-like protein
VKFLQTQENLNHTYRIIFIPETIGALTFLKTNLRNLKKNCVAGLVATCLGDEGNFSHIPTPSGNTISDKIAKYILTGCNAKYYEWSDRGSDERQFCWPTIGLPICSITRSKYREYSQYHTSLDDLNFVSRSALQESIRKYIDFCVTLELNKKYVNTIFGEPQLSKRNLYAALSKVGSTARGVKFLDIMNLLDGTRDLIDVSIKLGRTFNDVVHDIQILREFDLVKEKR